MCIDKAEFDKLKESVDKLIVEVKGMKIKYDEVYEYMEINQTKKWEKFSKKIQKQMDDFVEGVKNK